MAKVYNESALENALEDLYQEWGKLGFWARRLHQKFSPGRQRYVGGIAAVRSVLNTRTYGFSFLRERKKLNLTVENLVLRPEWNELFCDEDRALARKRIAGMLK